MVSPQIPDAGKGREGQSEESHGGSQGPGNHAGARAQDRRPQGPGLGSARPPFISVAAEEEDAHIVPHAQQHGAEAGGHEVHAAQDPARETKGPDHAHQQGHHDEAIARQGAETEPVDEADEKETQAEAQQHFHGQAMGFPGRDGMGSSDLEGEGPPRGAGQGVFGLLQARRRGQGTLGTAPQPGHGPGGRFGIRGRKARHQGQQDEAAILGLEIARPDPQCEGPSQLHGLGHALAVLGCEIAEAKRIKAGQGRGQGLRRGQSPGRGSEVELE